MIFCPFLVFFINLQTIFFILGNNFKQKLAKMPKNKFALIRYRVINRCFREKKYCTLQELKDACQRALDVYPIGDRTIAGDIHAMRYDSGLGYFAPIRVNKNRGVYYYEDKDYSIDSIPLNDSELDALVFAAKLMEQFGDVEIFERFRESANKLREALSLCNVTDPADLAARIDMEKPEAYPGLIFFNKIINALRERKVLRVEYQKFVSSQTSEYFIHPYLLKEYRNRWYLVGYVQDREGIRCFGLDRIKEIEEALTHNFNQMGFDCKEYYQNVVGVSVYDAEPEKIRISLTEKQARYVISQPIHNSQKIEYTSPTRVVVSYYLIPNYEFIAQVLSWGGDAEVLEPFDLRNKIRDIGLSIAKNYID